MRYKVCAAVVVGTVSLMVSSAWSQTSVIQQNSTSARTSVIQQNSISVNGEGSSVTVTGRSISVETTAAGGGRVVGNGEPSSEDRPIGPVTAIHSDGAFALSLRNGSAPRLTIETDKNILPIIKTTVSNGRLDIYSDRSYSLDGRIKVTVSSPNLTDISASGSNQIEGEGFAGGPLTISLNGSSSAVLAGRVVSLTCVMGGANHLSARHLAADSADVTLNGSGDAAVNASQRIVAVISGAGSLAVYGNPKSRETQVNGAGKITFVE
jgi:Putative auto-transporter adhesin, head GIN domain